MSASGKLKALGDYSDLNMPSDYIDRLDAITDALPQIVAVIEAAEEEADSEVDRFFDLRAALTALDEALS